jgi:hypothetical protein
VASDIIQADHVQEVLAFVESTYLSGGGAFELPATMGAINAMTFFRNAATGTGVGALLVFGSEGVAAYAVSAPRDQWQTTDLSQVVFFDSGTESTASIISVNDDVLFRHHDGLRSVRYTASQVAGGSGNLSNVPLSAEVNSVLDLDSRLERYYASATYVNNRVFLTSAGASHGTDVVFKALIALDVANVSSISSQKASPAYDSIFTGHNFLSVLKARMDYVDYAFAFVRIGDTGTRNELWYLDDLSDTSYEDQGPSPIESKLVTRTYDFGVPKNTKEYKYTEIWLADARGEIVVNTAWRSDGYRLWNAGVPYEFDSCLSALSGSLPQSRWRLRMPPAGIDTYDPVSGRDVRAGTSFQFCLEWSGSVMLEKVIFVATPVTEGVPDTGCDVATCVPLVEGSGGTTKDMYDYVIPPLTPLTAGTTWDALILGREALLYWSFEYVEDGYVYGTINVLGPYAGGTARSVSDLLKLLGDDNRSEDKYVPKSVARSSGSPQESVEVPFLGIGDVAGIKARVPVADALGIPWDTCVTLDNVPKAVQSTDTTAQIYGSGSDATPYVEIAMSAPPSFALAADGVPSLYESFTITNVGNIPITGLALEAGWREVVGGTHITLEYTLEEGSPTTTSLPLLLPAGLAVLASKTIYVRATCDTAWDEDTDVKVNTWHLSAAASGKATPVETSTTRFYQTPDGTQHPYVTGGIEQTYTDTDDGTLTVTVTPYAAVMAVSPASISVTAAVGDASTSVVTITNTGDAGTTLEWTAAAGASLGSNVTLSAASGSVVEGTPGTVTLTFNTDTAGTYDGDLVFTDANGLTETITISVVIVPLYTGDLKAQIDETDGGAWNRHTSASGGSSVNASYDVYWSIQYQTGEYLQGGRVTATKAWSFYIVNDSSTTPAGAVSFRASDGYPSYNFVGIGPTPVNNITRTVAIGPDVW